MLLEPKDTDSSSAGLIGILEKPWLLVWMLRVLIVTLFIDLALVITGQKSLLLKGLTTMILVDPGVVLLSICAFGIYVCTLAPLSLQLFKKLVWVNLPRTIPYRAPDYSRGYIRAHQVLKQAMLTENEFWTARYELHTRRELDEQKYVRTVALLLWTTLLLVGAEIILSARYFANTSLLIPALLESAGELEGWIIAFSFVLAALWTISACLDLSIESKSMYCPPYAAEEYRKQCADEQRQREFKEQLRRDLKTSTPH
ncbi:hypothetical protein ACXHWJ_03945 [Alcaligenes nematophilus]|uniref:hypothetical protein n=1 Tax=Alcaligenes faecalis TaxID=511 RepID=UPI001933F1D4|nr:hypothetical protein [Alcaligenes faecalis]QRF90772.1 hypothetical protein CLH39_11240 [Alcaligenes faecalis]